MHFLYPLKCFQWVEKGGIGNEWVKVNSAKLLLNILFPKLIDIAANNFLQKKSSFGPVVPTFNQNSAFLFGNAHICELEISSSS